MTSYEDHLATAINMLKLNDTLTVEACGNITVLLVTPLSNYFLKIDTTNHTVTSNVANF